MYGQWNMCIMDTLGLIIRKCPDYQGVLIFQVSLYDKALSRVHNTYTEESILLSNKVAKRVA